MFRLNPNYGQEDSTLVVARFETREAARECYRTLKALFAEIDEKLAELYQSRDGEACLEDIRRIYASYGFMNENGWHQSAPPVLDDREVIWPLDTGAALEDAENLLAAMEPAGVHTYSEAEVLEDWQRYPHPVIMPLPEDEDAFALPVLTRNNPGGRRLH